MILILEGAILTILKPLRKRRIVSGQPCSVKCDGVLGLAVTLVHIAITECAPRCSPLLFTLFCSLCVYPLLLTPEGDGPVCLCSHPILYIC